MLSIWRHLYRVDKILFIYLSLLAMVIATAPLD